jgi:hypothetical protein
MNARMYDAAWRMRNDTMGCTLLACLLVGVFGGAMMF